MTKIMITMSLWQGTLHDWPSPTQGDLAFLRITADVKWVVLWSTILSVASDLLENARQCHENALKDDGNKVGFWLISNYGPEKSAPKWVWEGLGLQTEFAQNLAQGKVLG